MWGLLKSTEGMGWFHRLQKKGPLVTRPAPAYSDYSDVQLVTCEASGYWAVLASTSWPCSVSSSPVTAPPTSVPYLGRRVRTTQSFTLNRLPLYSGLPLPSCDSAGLDPNQSPWQYVHVSG